MSSEKFKRVKRMVVELTEVVRTAKKSPGMDVFIAAKLEEIESLLQEDLNERKEAKVSN